MIALDHVGMPARDPAASARLLAEILSLPPAKPDGPDGEIHCLSIGGSAALLFTPAANLSPLYVAFRVDPASFAGVVDRLRAKAVAFGNDPEDSKNGQTADPLGGHGRLYFLDPDGHLYEVVA